MALHLITWKEIVSSPQSFSRMICEAACLHSSFSLHEAILKHLGLFLPSLHRVINMPKELEPMQEQQ
jgi:hypothetical protein